MNLRSPGFFVRVCVCVFLSRYIFAQKNNERKAWTNYKTKVQMEIAPGMVWQSLLLTVYILNAIQVAENLTMCEYTKKDHTNGKWVALNALKYKIFHKLVQLQKSSGAKPYGKEHIEVINWSVFVIRLKFIVMCTWVHSTNENLVNIANQPVLTYFNLRIYFPCGTFAFQKNNQILNHF